MTTLTNVTTTTGTATIGTATEVWRASDFYHSDLRREFVEDRLKVDGDFLIRKSGDGKGMVVSVLWKNQFRHCAPIERQQGDKVFYSFGRKEFNSINELVEYHYKNRVPLGDPLQTNLLHAIRSPKTKYKESEVEVLQRLGGGNFGDVYKVRIKSDDGFAAMKTLKEGVTQAAREAFQQEMDMMRSMYHENVVQYMGTVVPDKGAPQEIKILLELVNQGSLERLLHKGKVTERGKSKICLQAARGMAYLHKHHIIHRDLAARNILIHVSSDNQVTAKVSDFGLSRHDSAGRGYELKNSQKLPLKWMAPECFENRLWTMPSDVWSLGILMWEVFSNGQDPYSEPAAPQTAPELSRYIRNGNHPLRIDGIKEEIWGVMMSCWKKDPKHRPTMEEVVSELDRIYSSLVKKDKSIDQQ